MGSSGKTAIYKEDIGDGKYKYTDTINGDSEICDINGVPIKGGGKDGDKEPRKDKKGR